MSWHAVDAVDEAVDATRQFLFPFSLVRWTKLALLVLLMGGGGGASVNASVSAVSDTGTSPGGIGSSPTGVDPGAVGADPGAVGVDPGAVGIDWGAMGIDPVDVGIDLGSVTLDELAGTLDPVVLVGLAVGLVLLIAALSVASLSLRLVFYDALRTNEVRIWRPFLSRLRQSLGLFLFTVILSAAAAAPVALAVLVAAAADAPIGWAPVDSFARAVGSLALGPTVALGLLGAGLVAVAALALRFTYEFVVPTMIVEEAGTLAGWGRFWRTLRTEWTDFAVYLVVHAIVSLGLSVVEGITAVFAFALVATVAGLVLLLVAAALGGLGALVGTTVGVAALVLVVGVGAAVLLVLVLPVRVVTRSYRIAYEVSTLGGIDPDLALLRRDLDSGGSGSTERDAVDPSNR